MGMITGMHLSLGSMLAIAWQYTMIEDMRMLEYFHKQRQANKIITQYGV